MSEERLKRAGEIVLVPVEQIIVSDEINNGRIDFGDLNELADSIENSTLQVPLTVQKVKNENKYVLIQGKRRFKAIQILLGRGVEYKAVKCVQVPHNYAIENTLFDQIVLNDGKPYSNLEQGMVFAQLVGRGFTAQDIAKRVGKSLTHIANCIEMSALPKKVRDMVAKGSVSGHTAVELSKVVSNEDELVSKLENAVESAPVKSNGKKKKVTKKAIKQIANTSPLKKMDDVKKILKAEGVKNNLTEFFDKFVSRLKAGESTESLVELFK